jgi:hypothetical protein
MVRALAFSGMQEGLLTSDETDRYSISTFVAVFMLRVAN